MFPTIDKRKTGIKLRKLMDQHGMTVKDVQKYLHLGSVQSVYHWLNGISLPSVDNLYALSQLFHIPVDDMLCGNRVPISNIENPQCKRLDAYVTKLRQLRVA